MTHTQTGFGQPPLKKPLRLSQLSEARRQLIRLCQTINYGQILGLEFRGGEPVLCPKPAVLLDLKLDVDDEVRPEFHLPDFVLSEENHRLLAKMDAERDG